MRFKNCRENLLEIFHISLFVTTFFLIASSPIWWKVESKYVFLAYMASIIFLFSVLALGYVIKELARPILVTKKIAQKYLNHFICDLSRSRRKRIRYIEPMVDNNKAYYIVCYTVRGI